MRQGDLFAPQPMQAGDCPDIPADQFNIDFRFGNTLISFTLASHAGRFYCAPIVQCPKAGYARPFSSRPAFNSKRDAFDHAKAECEPFIEEHGGSAVKSYRLWNPALPK